MSKATFTLSTNITDAEAFTLTRLGHHEQWHGHISCERRSEREYDLSIDGGHSKYGSPVGFRAWLPLAMLHLWWGDKQCGHLVNDFGTGDFSFVRDAEPAEIWAMFDACRAADGYEHDSPNCSLAVCPGYRDPHDFYNEPGYWLAMMLYEAGEFVDIDNNQFNFFERNDIRQYDAYCQYEDADIMLNPTHFYGVQA